jgi:hypothetical protein
MTTIAMASVENKARKIGKPERTTVRVPHTRSRCGMVLLNLPEILGIEDKWYGSYDDHPNYTNAQWCLLGTEADNGGAMRGDVVRSATVEDSERNGGVLGVWDGKKILPLDSDPDDYGTLPKELASLVPGCGKGEAFSKPEEFGVLGEFPLYYWKDQIDHNSFVWVHDPRRFLPQLLAHRSDIFNSALATQRNKPDYYLSPPPANSGFLGAFVVLQHGGERFKFVFDTGYNTPDGCSLDPAELVDLKYSIMLDEFSGTEPVLCSYAAEHDPEYAGTLVLGYY